VLFWHRCNSDCSRFYLAQICLQLGRVADSLHAFTSVVALIVPVFLCYLYWSLQWLASKTNAFLLQIMLVATGTGNGIAQYTLWIMSVTLFVGFNLWWQIIALIGRKTNKVLQIKVFSELLNGFFIT